MEKMCKNCIYHIPENCNQDIMKEVLFGVKVDENHTCQFVELKKQ